MNMKKMMVAGAMLIGAGAHGAELRLQVEQLSPEKGELMLMLYDDPAAFAKLSGGIYGIRIHVRGSSQQVVFSDLPPGRYAVAAFQDFNGNGVLDMGLFGRPQEPVGFTRDAIGRMGPPSFEQAAVEVGEQGLEGMITMRRFGEGR